MLKMDYLIIRLWAPRSECSNPEEAHYVARIEHDDNIQWTLTREFTEANYFKSQKTAERVVRGVRRIAERVDRGWYYEIIRIKEEVIDTNVPEQERKQA